MIGDQCPLPGSGDGDRIQLAHGEGGRLMRSLLGEVIIPTLGNDLLAQAHDGCVLPTLNGPAVFTTDSYVVTPLLFPGGDIGKLAVYGTSNDLAVSGARPRWLSLSLIIEEGLSLSFLRRILQSIADAAREADVQVVTGDTKVVPRGAADGLFITTSGVGELMMPAPWPEGIQPGDAILVTGPIGRHGIAVLAARERLEMDPVPTSDTGALFPAVAALHEAGVPIHALRDCTRGGLTAVLHEWAHASRTTMIIEGSQVPVLPETRGLCELLGLDPFHCACEGTMAIALPADHVNHALQVLQSVNISASAVHIGEAVPRQISPVAVRRSLGQLVALDEPWGAPLPRIC
ncbi:MAG: hydrogenase expression/formation protein HypE [Planctomycetaceae bacterium]|nr:hydrogenase expression/formation protein HypE [Planctomycetaceae bacterium]